MCETPITFKKAESLLKKHGLKESSISNDCMIIAHWYKIVADNLSKVIKDPTSKKFTNDSGMMFLFNKVIVYRRNQNFWTWYSYMVPLLVEKPLGIDLVKDYEKLLLSDDKQVVDVAKRFWMIHENAQHGGNKSTLSFSHYGLEKV